MWGAVNWTDPLGLWSVKGSIYRGSGGSASFEYDQGQFFVRFGVGVGFGGDFRIYPDGDFPSSEENSCGCGKRGFIGISLSANATLLKFVSAEVKGQAGWVITQNCDGKPQIEYVEDAPKFDWSIKNKKPELGWGLGLGSGFNIIDGGVAW
jgi:hypothetical protein